jgi:hypothetical protein
MFDPQINTLADFVDYYKERVNCDEAVDFGYNHTWDDDPRLAPMEYVYVCMRDFLPVLSPTLRWMGIARLGDDSFWAARAWMTIPNLTMEEYHFLFARGYPKEKFAERVESGALTPGSRAMVSTAAPGGAAP